MNIVSSPLQNTSYLHHCCAILACLTQHTSVASLVMFIDELFLLMHSLLVTPHHTYKSLYEVRRLQCFRDMTYACHPGRVVANVSLELLLSVWSAAPECKAGHCHHQPLGRIEQRKVTFRNSSPSL